MTDKTVTWELTNAKIEDLLETLNQVSDDVGLTQNQCSLKEELLNLLQQPAQPKQEPLLGVLQQYDSERNRGTLEEFKTFSEADTEFKRRETENIMEGDILYMVKVLRKTTIEKVRRFY